eukprot:Amastigsp_a5222_11.p1 type:complete len:263 gc:universal Amastigsp_a5222_11:84-872(+)
MAVATNQYRNVCPVETMLPRIVAPAPPSAAAGGAAAAARADGREWNQFRRLHAQTGVVSQATGSAYLEVGATKVVCAIYGPRPSKKDEFHETGLLTCSLRFLPFAVGGAHRRDYTPQDDEKEASLIVHDALAVAVRLDRFPKSVVEVHVTVLEGSDTAAIAAAASCASLALLEAGIEMYDVVGCCAVSAVGDVLVVDPTAEEQRRQTGSVIAALLPELDQISQVVQTGRMAAGAVADALALALDGCRQVAAVLCAASEAKKL